MSKGKSITERFLGLDRRIIYIVLFIAMIIPILRPIGLPIAISPQTQNMYNAVQTLPNGSVVLLESDMSVGNWGVLGPQMIALLNQLAKLNVKTVIASFAAYEGPVLAIQGVNSSNMKNRNYGVDYVILPFVAGEETAIAQFCKSVSSVVTTDVYGTSLSQLQIMSGINSANDIQLWAGFHGGGTWAGFEGQLRQVTPFLPRLILVAGWFGVLTSGYTPYYTSGQVKGYMNDLRGAAEYELLVGVPGTAVAATDSGAFAAILLLFFMVFGNVLLFVTRHKKESEK